MSDKPEGWARVDGKTLRQKIAELLAERGPMTSLEMAGLLGYQGGTVRNTVSVMREATVSFPKQVYICGWTSDAVDGRKSHLRPIYDLGDKPDVRKPNERIDPVTKKRSAFTETNPAIGKHFSTKGMVSSVFDLGHLLR